MPADRPIYLDYNATTPVDPEVQRVIAQALTELWGNASSTHVYGRTAHKAMERARAQVAALINAKPHEIIFTGGGSEASNHAIQGVCLQPAPRLQWSSFWKTAFRIGRLPSDCHIITSTVEHPATNEPLFFLERLGASVTRLAVDRTGLVDPDQVRRSIRWHTRLVTIMHSNNETGTLMPIAEIGQLCRERNVVFHTDCAQSLGKVPVDVQALKVDLLTIAGHKLYAPKGVGALYVREGVALEPLIHGAGHESARRAGTENLPYIVGLGQAAEMARLSFPEAGVKLQQLRDRLFGKLQQALGLQFTLNGHPELRLPNTLNVNFHGQIGPQLLANVPGIAASNGAACHETPAGMHFAPSAVLCAMRVPPEISLGAVRLTVGRYTTEAEVDEAARLLIQAVEK
jgi:cysteine desulfurase